MQPLLHHEDHKAAKNQERNHFLQDLELRKTEMPVAHAIGGNHEAVFKKGDAPTDENRRPKRAVLVGAQMAIPGPGHENVADDKQQDRKVGTNGHYTTLIEEA